MTFRPMLAASKSITPDEVASLSYPLLVSPKLDGIRCLITEEGAVTRSLKPIPNTYIRNKLKALPVGFDGELIVGSMTGNDVFNRTTSGVMSEAGEPQFIFHVFDNFRHPGAFVGRFASVRKRMSYVSYDVCPAFALPHHEMASPTELAAYEQCCVRQGFEGIMIRDPAGSYKFGRATRKEGSLLKYKRFEDAEATIIGIKEKQHNANEAKINALGLTERSTHKANKIGTGVLGAFECVREVAGDGAKSIYFDLSGFTDQQREEFWEARDKLVGRTVKFKHQGLTPEGKPRFPVFQGFRDARDL